ncbi:MAG TPA: hypothetical protein VLK28_04640 [Methylomirabilota bacterium]|nr:hypothetical protein [Methylomirabilota bacterium]
MAGRAGWMAMLLGALLVALPAPVLADSSQAALAVSVVVPARCAVRTPGIQGSIPAVAGPDTVAMRCTRGVLPTDPGAAATAVGPRISSSAEGGARMIVTVNF